MVHSDYLWGENPCFQTKKIHFNLLFIIRIFEMADVQWPLCTRLQKTDCLISSDSSLLIFIPHGRVIWELCDCSVPCLTVASSHFTWPCSSRTTQACILMRVNPEGNGPLDSGVGKSPKDSALIFVFLQDVTTVIAPWHGLGQWQQNFLLFLY